MSARRLAMAMATVLVLGGCASALRGGANPPAGPATDGWRALDAGDSRRAGALFQQAVAASPSDEVAAFGLATLAFERAEARALDLHLALLERAAGSGEAGLAAAIVARLPALLEEAVDPRGAETRLQRLADARLGWRARLGLADVRIGIARRRGDARLLNQEVGRAGCLTRAQDLGRVGRLPRLDLTVASRSGSTSAVSARACRFRLPARDGLPGVRALLSQVQVAAAGDQEIVLEASGPAALRVNDGAWHAHGTDQAYGSARSAVRVRLAAGTNRIEARVGSFGGHSDLSVYVLPAGPPEEPSTKWPTEAASVLRALIADAAGEADPALEQMAALEQRRRFAVGLAVAARLASRDPSRPTNLARDRARATFRRALDLDPAMPRVLRDLGQLDLADDRARDAAENAERARSLSPSFWPAELLLSDALAARGFERLSDEALDRALTLVAPGPGACDLRDRAWRRARQRFLTAQEDRLARQVAACDALLDAPIETLRRRGDLVGLSAALARAAAVSPAPDWLDNERASVLLARGDAAGAVRVLAALSAAAPRDASLRLRLADAQAAAGDREGARKTVAEAAATFPVQQEVRSAARAIGLPSPFDPFRVDGAAQVRTFRKAGPRYNAPAVMVLDRTVHRVFADGTQAVLTHNIVQVATKDGMDRWGEIPIPDGAEVLTLRTHKPDGSTREPEEIAGKATISAPDLAPGDAIEWETLEWREPADAFAPGFVGERFYFQSTEAPLDLSEYVVITPAALAPSIDARAGAPAPVLTEGPDGTRVRTFRARAMAQLFGERAGPPEVDWIPSVRVSHGVSLQAWSRFLSDELYGVARLSPPLRAVAARIAAEARAAGREDPPSLAAAVVRYVEEQIEPGGDLVEPASLTLARGRGNRVGVILALARALKLPAEVAFVRSRAVAAPDTPVVLQELDDFGDVLLRFRFSKDDVRWVDARLRQAPFGYIPPLLHQAPAFRVGSTDLERARSSVADRRQVTLRAQVEASGRAQVQITETLHGWPALEWSELARQTGRDKARLRREFEQRWLSHHFPGAQLEEVAIDLDKRGRGASVRYRFVHPQLAAVRAGELRLRPTFFESQPGRRYATEASRRTALVIGPEVPVDLDAQLTFPAGSQVQSAGEGGRIVAGRGGELRLEEKRSANGDAGAPQVWLQRRTELPLLRVPADGYPTVAGALRRMDPLERSEIRVRLPQPSTTGSASR